LNPTSTTARYAVNFERWSVNPGCIEKLDLDSNRSRQTQEWATGGEPIAFGRVRVGRAGAGLTN